jgi:hypothetical protein
MPVESIKKRAKTSSLLLCHVCQKRVDSKAVVLTIAVENKIGQGPVIQTVECGKQVDGVVVQGEGVCESG